MSAASLGLIIPSVGLLVVCASAVGIDLGAGCTSGLLGGQLGLMLEEPLLDLALVACHAELCVGRLQQLHAMTSRRSGVVGILGEERMLHVLVAVVV